MDGPKKCFAEQIHPVADSQKFGSDFAFLFCPLPLPSPIFMYHFSYLTAKHASNQHTFLLKCCYIKTSSLIDITLF